MARQNSIPSIRLDDLEENKLMQLMEQHNMKKTELVRSLIMNAKLKPPLIDKTVGLQLLEDIRRVGTEVNKMGVNINQIAKHLNQQGLKDEHAERLNNTLFQMVKEQQDLKEEVNKVWQQLSTLLAKK
ncbi:plasmid mobilization relaxosome protein MobC [Priestia filamentosa]|uniref:plasmid mobilization relaxosome protein MobC n=1 Tax=Priestia filamentosa TaxID=1402861 RepID=UPI003982D2B7